MAKTVAWECGFDAYRDGVMDTACPFNEGTAEAAEWLKGWNEALEEDADLDAYEDSMDGDHESALASAGWGTDEDY